MLWLWLWLWLDCGGGAGALIIDSKFGHLRVVRKGFLELGPEGSSFNYTFSTRLMKESSSGKAVRMWKTHTKISVVENYNLV